MVVVRGGGGRSPGPDRFTLKFLKSFWSLISNDVMNVVRYFEAHGTLGRGCNSSFITLAAKIKDPTVLSDYRPISLIGSIYKIISKVLASRLKTLIGGVIDDTQSAYVEGRNILDGPLIINEVFSWAKKTGKELLLFKVDFDKAFYSVNLEFLDSAMSQMGFGSKWRKRMRGCLISAKASVIINGSSVYEFDISKGVR